MQKKIISIQDILSTETIADVTTFNRVIMLKKKDEKHNGIM